MKKTLTLFTTLLTAGMLLTGGTAYAQKNLTQPRSSQKAKVMQRIGLTDMKVVYHSPLTKGRTIWGKLVPYNEVWRAGANENTVFYTSTDIMVEGQRLPAGSYGLHMIPTREMWTVIFSRASESWGSFTYDKAEDALRVDVKPRVTSNQDWLSYQFTDLAPESATLTLRWEKMEIPVKISVDVAETVYAHMQQELRGLPGFFWESHFQAAKHCFDHDIHPEAAMASVERSISINPAFNNLNLKSQMLAKAGKKDEAAKLKEKAFELATEQQLNLYGYELMGTDKVDEAIVIFKMNIKRYPKSWNVYDSLGEAYLNKGDRKQALAQYKTALSMAPEAQHKRIKGMIAKAENLAPGSLSKE